MALSAYIFIESTPGKISQVVEAVAKLPGAKMPHAVTGSYDVIAGLHINPVSPEDAAERLHGVQG